MIKLYPSYKNNLNKFKTLESLRLFLKKLFLQRINKNVEFKDIFYEEVKINDLFYK